LAVVASSQAGEDTIVNVLSSFDSIEFVRIKEIYQSEAPTLFGVLVALRKNERLKVCYGNM
jgi:hypothetical protein